VRAGCELVFESFARWRKQVRQNPAFASIHFNGRFPVNDTVPAVGDDPQPIEETPAAADSALNWGRSGGVESTTERGDAEIPAAAESASGFQSVASASTTSPMPSTLGRPLTPVSGSGVQGNWNSSSIFENTKIG
jgi:hypothetical protein